jgi:hypothetical protein
VYVRGQPVRFRIDTGADISVINSKTAEELDLSIQKDSTERGTLLDAGGRELQKQGKACVPIFYKDRKIMGTLHVVQRAPQNLLGIPELEALQMLRRVNGTILVEKQFPGLYRELGQLPEIFKIKLKEGAEPYAISVPRKLPLGLREATERELKRMERLGVIERVEDYREWCAGMVVAPKTNGDVRICVDLTTLNRSVKRENKPLPRVDETLALLERSRMFSKMGANS